MSRNIQVFDDAKDAVSEAEFCADVERIPYAIIVYDNNWFGVLKNEFIEIQDHILEVVTPH